MSSKVWRWVLGLIYIFAVATIWIAASFVVQSVVDAGVSPFLITFICNSLFVVYLPLFEIGRYLEDAYGSLLFWRNKRSHLRELVESEKAVLLGQDVSGVKSDDATEGSGLVVREEGDSEDGNGIESGLENVELEIDGSVNVSGETGGICSKGLDEKGRWTRMRVAKVSLMICPFWFLAQLTFNLSLKYTTVTVRTYRKSRLVVLILNLLLCLTEDFFPFCEFAVKYHFKQCIEPFHISCITSILGREVHVVETLQRSSLYVWDHSCEYG